MRHFTNLHLSAAPFDDEEVEDSYVPRTGAEAEVEVGIEKKEGDEVLKETEEVEEEGEEDEN